MLTKTDKRILINLIISNITSNKVDQQNSKINNLIRTNRPLVNRSYYTYRNIVYRYAYNNFSIDICQPKNTIKNLKVKPSPIHFSLVEKAEILHTQNNTIYSDYSIIRQSMEVIYQYITEIQELQDLLPLYIFDNMPKEKSTKDIILKYPQILFAYNSIIETSKEYRLDEMLGVNE